MGNKKRDLESPSRESSICVTGISEEQSGETEEGKLSKKPLLVRLIQEGGTLAWQVLLGAGGSARRGWELGFQRGREGSECTLCDCGPCSRPGPGISGSRSQRRPFRGACEQTQGNRGNGLHEGLGDTLGRGEVKAKARGSHGESAAAEGEQPGPSLEHLRGFNWGFGDRGRWPSLQKAHAGCCRAAACAGQ